MKKDKNIIKPQYNPCAVFIELNERMIKKEKELHLQKELDFQKWLESEYKHCDTSGMMDQCLFCQYRNEKRVCTCNPEVRAKEATCAKAYAKMQEKLGRD